VKTAILPTEQHTWLDFGHMKHCTVLPQYTKFLIWSTYLAKSVRY